MTRTARAAVIAVALFALTAVGFAPAHAQPLKRYANCTALNRTYPAGVAKSSAAADRAVRGGMRRPRVSASTYADNRGSDRDKDGVACEQSA
jgi:hypothetical protein